MSKDAVNQIVQRAVDDDAYFELLRTNPERATADFDLDDAERQAFSVGAYNVVVRSTRKERSEQASLAAARPSVGQTTATSSVPTAAAETGHRASGGGVALLTFLILIFGAAGGSLGFRYVEHQWPWQALGFGKAASPGGIPTPTLGARPQPTTATGSAAASASRRPAASTSASASAKPAASSTSSATDIAVQKAYYDGVGQRFLTVNKTYLALLTALRAGNDTAKPLSDLEAALADLKQQLPGAVPPANLDQQHQTLTQAVPLLQSDLSQLRTAIDQKNQVQSVLIATEMQAVFGQLQDELTFANAPHPEFYQPIDTKQPLPHVLEFDVLAQNVTQRSGGPASVQLRIALRSDNPSSDELGDTLHHGVVVARQNFPQATKVQVVGFKEINGQVSQQQIGTADWTCSPDTASGGTSPSPNWQQECSKISEASATSPTPTVIPY